MTIPFSDRQPSGGGKKNNGRDHELEHRVKVDTRNRRRFSTVRVHYTRGRCQDCFRDRAILSLSLSLRSLDSDRVDKGFRGQDGAGK